VDMGRVSRGLAREGMDTRHWVSYGTVATVHGEDGKPSYTDPHAVVITPSGIDVDVILEPSGCPTTCTYGRAGQVSFLAPIHPGDQVLVVIPDGDLSMVPRIVEVIGGASAPLPVEEDGKPVFRNDRLSIFARGVPVEVRTDGGSAVRVRPDGSVQVASKGIAIEVGADGTIQLGANAADALIKGTAYRSAQAAQSAAILAGLAAIIGVAVGPLAALQPGLQALQLAWQTFEEQSGGFLSAVVKTE
jgi:hypothetical protein